MDEEITGMSMMISGGQLSLSVNEFITSHLNFGKDSAEGDSFLSRVKAVEKLAQDGSSDREFEGLANLYVQEKEKREMSTSTVP